MSLINILSYLPISNATPVFFLIKTYLYIPLSNRPLPLSLPPNPLLVCHQELRLSDQQTHLYLRTLLRVFPTPIYLS